MHEREQQVEALLEVLKKRKELTARNTVIGWQCSRQQQRRIRRMRTRPP
jgi:hypothetical protein